ncbi:MAG: hypothetical protein RLZZ36_384 [Pseudomonadota bacterium]|jgi:cytoskeletal protein CcmA (bactofilin family)
MFGRRKTPPVPGRIDTLIGREARLTGDIEFAAGLHLEGRVTGNVRSLVGAGPATLWIGESGAVVGNVDVAHVVVNGEVVGDVRGSERVVLGEKARVTGDVYYGAIEMTLGARVEGKLIPQPFDARPVET